MSLRNLELDRSLDPTTEVALFEGVHFPRHYSLQAYNAQIDRTYHRSRAMCFLPPFGQRRIRQYHCCQTAESD